MDKGVLGGDEGDDMENGEGKNSCLSASGKPNPKMLPADSHLECTSGYEFVWKLGLRKLRVLACA